ncbi:MAG TPA: NAD(P)-dependent oxidoreductase [Nitrososphaeraceae archaeon]|nr:NAD(P)-dependent oxidoreductase [Nitrososphaeraceae archaeon]
MNIGVIGLGLMGSQIASRLISTGHVVSVYNRDATKTKPFEKVDVRIANSPKELAQNSDFIIICVTDFEAILQVSFGTEGIVDSNRKNLIVANSSTISPNESKYCANLFRKRQIEMLGMPIMGGPSVAAKGELVSIIAGNKEVFEKVRPTIEKLSTSVFYIGSTDGYANAVKLALNLNIALIASAISEGVTVVKASGIDPQIFIEILNATYFKTGLSENKGPKMVKNNFEPSFYLKDMLKDLELVTSTAQSIGVFLPLATIAQQIYRAANNSGFSQQDYTAILAFLAKINEVDNKNEIKYY